MIRSVHRSLILALALFGLAAVLLTVDSAWGVDTRLDVEEDGSWRTIAVSGDERYPYVRPISGGIEMEKNGSATFRVLVVNDRPLPLDARVKVLAPAYAYGQAQETLVAEDVSIPRFDSAPVRFEITERLLREVSGEVPKVEGQDAEFRSIDLLVQVDNRDHHYHVGFRVTS